MGQSAGSDGSLPVAAGLDTVPGRRKGGAMTTEARIRAKLTAALQPSRLVIHDDSHRHAGHQGARPGGETHFRVEIVSASFAGQNRVGRQRAVYGILAEELAAGVHALQLTTLTPDEDAKAAVPPPACH